MATKAKKAKKVASFPQTIWVEQPNVQWNGAHSYNATDDIQEYGYSDEDVWAEYQLVRKVKARTNFELQEVK